MITSVYSNVSVKEIEVMPERSGDKNKMEIVLPAMVPMNPSMTENVGLEW